MANSFWTFSINSTNHTVQVVEVVKWLTPTNWYWCSIHK